MSEPRYADYTPEWAKTPLPQTSALWEAPLTGVEPPLAPRLPTRLIPRHDAHSVTALTLVGTIEATQKIVTYAAQEAGHGVQYEFADLRSVDTKLAELSRLHIDPFESGSFVIPAYLDERSVEVRSSSGARDISSGDILQRFIEAMEGAATGPDFSASLGLLNAISNLGSVLRREALAIEFFPTGATKARRKKVTVNENYISAVSSNVRKRLDLKYEADSLEGILTAVDVTRGKLKILVSGQELPGNFETLAAENVISGLNKAVELGGVVGRNQRGIPVFIRVFHCEILDK